MRQIWKAGVAGVGALAAAWLFAVSTPHWMTTRQTKIVDTRDNDLIARGKYIA